MIRDFVAFLVLDTIHIPELLISHLLILYLRDVSWSSVHGELCIIQKRCHSFAVQVYVKSRRGRYDVNWRRARDLLRPLVSGIFRLAATKQRRK